MARLVVITPPTAGGAYELGAPWATIGRADGNTIQIADISVSGRHCEVKLHGGELVVRDLLSTNGTFIGGRKITEGVLSAGQALRLGDVQLRFEAISPVGTSAPPPIPAIVVPLPASGA